MKRVCLLVLLNCFTFQSFSQTSTFNFNGTTGLGSSGINGTPQAYVVPAGVTIVGIDMKGAAGGWPCCSWTSTGGPIALGGRVQCTMNVTPGTTLWVYVGGAGANNLNSATQSPGGWNGGGIGGAVGSAFCAGGGGATDIRTSTTGAYASSVLGVAGGGGGGGDFGPVGGAGGGITGGMGQAYPCLCYTGGACGGGQTGPSCGTGTALGTQGQGGQSLLYSDGGGGGGGGWWGGNCGASDAGGGGGSSYPASPNAVVTSIVHTQGYTSANSNGQAVITVLCSVGTLTGNMPFCAGSTITLTPGISGGSFSTSDNTVATVDPSSGTVTGVAAGNANITFTRTCGSFVVATVTVNALPATNAGSNVAICHGSSTPLAATGAVTYSWAPAAGLTATTGANVVASPTVTTTYTVTGTGPVISSSSIVYNQAFTGGVPPSTQCTAWNTFRASLNSSLPYTGFTIKGSQNTTGISCTNPAVAAAVANALNTGTPYTGTSDGQTWRVNIGGCTTPVCGTIYVELSNQGSCSCASGYCLRPTINNSNWGGISGATCSAVSQTMEVDFFYSTACSSTSTVTVTVNPLPVTSAGSNVAICTGSSTTLTGSGATTYTWSPSAGLSSTTGASVVASPTVTTTYTAIGSSLGCSTPSNVTVTVNALPTIAFGTMPQICAGATSANLGFTGATDAITKSVTINYTGAMQPWTVPAGVTSIIVDALGANGGLDNNGITFDTAGRGGRVQATLAVTPGQVLNIFVGGQGNDGTPAVAGSGGYNGGGSGVNVYGSFSGGGGGGATDIRIGGIALADRVIVAGGGGGAGLDCGLGADNGGNGGGTTGADGNGAVCDGGQGFGGTPSAGGAGGICVSCGTGFPGIAGGLGIGGDAGAGTAGGGGGSGYYGGGGAQWNGGGGGSSYTDPTLATSVVHTQGYNTAGNGSITITWAIPTTYNIVWSPASTTAGFTDVINAPVASSPIAVTVPVTAPAATYAGTFTITNGNTGCTSGSYPVSITVKPIPDVAAVANQTVCNGASTTAVTFTGSLTGTTFGWTNANPSIGLPATGSGDIGAFIAANATSVPVFGVITVTPELNGCFGTPTSFADTVNPTPDVTPSSNQTRCNGDMTAAIHFTGSVSGTTFNWTNTDPTIGLAASGSGDIAAFTAINTTTSPVTAIITVNTTANGCTGSSNSFTIVVNPTPVMSSTLTPPAVCDNTVFSYTPASATTGTAFAWDRATVAGISNPAASGTDNPLETLHNTTIGNVTAVYVYTLTANGCTHSQSVSAVVKPTPVLTSTLTPPAICDSTWFIYGSSSATVGTTFTWSRATVPGISHPASSGADTIREILWNSTANPITVTYIDTLLANGCINTQSVTVAVNPRPILSSPLTIAPVCDGSSVLYVSASATTGTTFLWSRAATMTNPANAGIGDTITEVLYDTSANPLGVIYYDTLRANGCMNVQPVTLTVNPTPMISTPLFPHGICNGSTFNYPVASRTVGAVFTWNRPFILGIGNPAATGIGNPNETLINNTNQKLAVSYIYTVTANGCYHSQTVIDTVYPTPTMSSAATKKICSGADVNYYPTSYVTGDTTTFTWARAHVNGITPSAGSGTGPVHETLTDTAFIPFAVVYTFTLTANGCTNVQSVTVTINPAAPQLPITTHSPNTVCSNTLYQNFGTNAVPPVNQDYNWDAQNATVWATGNTNQYCLVNFNNPGYARVILKSNVTGFNSCVTNSYFDVNVTGSNSTVPQVVYFNGQFICLTTDEDNYQWGFDDGSTLDSTIIAGENNPNYFISAPDLNHRHYWVITNKAGCMEKTYYNSPVDITDVNAEETSLKVYPNPTKELLNVEINTSLSGNYTVEVVNMLGQKLSSTVATDHKARIDVAGIAAGVYLVDCYRDGVKAGAVRFIKY